MAALTITATVVWTADFENAEANLEVCPQCGSKHLDRLQRITGYLVGTTDRWNSGKLAELKDRVIHETE